MSVPLDIVEAFTSLAIALGLGLLVGMQRQRINAPLAGVRTFALIALLGALTAMLGLYIGAWIVGVGLVAIAGILMTANLMATRADPSPPGITTEVAVLLMFIAGAWLVHGPREIAVVTAGAATLLLHLKFRLHRLIRSLGDQDLRAIMQFVLVSLVILPVLPNRNFGSPPWDVLNPRTVWWMVVLVVGMSLAGYIAYRSLGRHAGLAISGLLGGLVSSTATTATAARKAAEGGPVIDAACIIMMASTVVYARVAAEVQAVAPQFLKHVALPLGILAGASAIMATLAYLKARREKNHSTVFGNPSELKSALMFGALFAVVLLAAAGAKHYFNDRGLYAVAAVSGLTDMDAITLSTAQLVQSGRLDPGPGWRSVVIAAMSNMVFKLGLVALLGGRRLLPLVGTFFGIKLAIGGVLLAVLK